MTILPTVKLVDQTLQDAVLPSPGTQTSSQGNLSEVLTENLSHLKNIDQVTKTHSLKNPSGTVQEPPLYLIFSESFSLSELNCSLCNKFYESDSKLTSHMSEDHTISSYYRCSRCGKIIQNHDHLDLQKDHSIFSIAICAFCR